MAQTNAVYDAVVLKKPSTILALNHEVYRAFHSTKGCLSFANPTSNSNHCVMFLNLLEWMYLTASSNSTLPYALGVLKKAGYKMVSVADCLGQKPYLSIGPPGIPAVSHAYFLRFSVLTPCCQADWIC